MKKGINKIDKRTIEEKEEIIKPLTKKEIDSCIHPAEAPLTAFAVLFTLGLNGFIAYLAYEALNDPDVVDYMIEFTEFDREFVNFLVKTGGYAIVVLYITLLIMIIYKNSSYSTKSDIENIKVKDYSSPKLNGLVDDYCKRLGLKKAPEVYVNVKYTDSSIFGVKIRGSGAVGVSNAIFNSAIRYENSAQYRFVIASMLAEIKLDHYNLFYQVFTFGFRLIPFFGKLYSRTLSYSVDRLAQKIVGDEIALKGAFEQIYNNFYFSYDDILTFIENKKKSMTYYDKISVFITNITSEYPLPVYRLSAFLEKDKPGRIL